MIDLTISIDTRELAMALGFLALRAGPNSLGEGVLEEMIQQNEICEIKLEGFPGDSRRVLVVKPSAKIIQLVEALKNSPVTPEPSL